MTSRGWEEKGKKERDPDFIFVDELGIGPTRLNIYSLSLPLFLSLALPPPSSSSSSGRRFHLLASSWHFLFHFQRVAPCDQKPGESPRVNRAKLTLILIR